MVVLKQESQFAKEYDRGFDRVIYVPLPQCNQMLLLPIWYVTIWRLSIPFISLTSNCPCMQLSLQIEQGIPVLSKWLMFNRFKFLASKGISLGPAFLLTRLGILLSCWLLGSTLLHQKFCKKGMEMWVRKYQESSKQGVSLLNEYQAGEDLQEESFRKRVRKHKKQIFFWASFITNL